MAKNSFLKTMSKNMGKRCTQQAIRSTYDLYDDMTGRKKRKKKTTF